jgi:hypothetical protein
MIDAFGSPMSGGKSAIDASIAKQRETVDKLFDIIRAYVGQMSSLFLLTMPDKGMPTTLGKISLNSSIVSKQPLPLRSQVSTSMKFR